jgi:hypothetical protein
MDALEERVAELNARAERSNRPLPSIALSARIEAVYGRIAQPPPANEQQAVLDEIAALEQVVAEKSQLADREDAVRAALRNASGVLAPGDVAAATALHNVGTVDAWRRTYFPVHDNALNAAQARLQTFRARAGAVATALKNVNEGPTFDLQRIQAGEALVAAALLGADAGLVAGVNVDAAAVAQAKAACADAAIATERTRLARVQRDDANVLLMAVTAGDVANAAAAETLDQFTAALAAAVHAQHHPSAVKWLQWIGYVTDQQRQHLRVRALGQIYGVNCHMSIYYNSVAQPPPDVNQAAADILDALVKGGGAGDSAHVTLEAFGRDSQRNPKRYRGAAAEQRDYVNQAGGRAWNVVSQKINEEFNAEEARILGRINAARAAKHV